MGVIWCFHLEEVEIDILRTLTLSYIHPILDAKYLPMMEDPIKDHILGLKWDLLRTWHYIKETEVRLRALKETNSRLRQVSNI